MSCLTFLQKQQDTLGSKQQLSGELPNWELRTVDKPPCWVPEDVDKTNYKFTSSLGVSGVGPEGGKIDDSVRGVPLAWAPLHKTTNDLLILSEVICGS